MTHIIYKKTGTPSEILDALDALVRDFQSVDQKEIIKQTIEDIKFTLQPEKKESIDNLIFQIEADLKRTPFYSTDKTENTDFYRKHWLGFANQKEANYTQGLMTGRIYSKLILLALQSAQLTNEQTTDSLNLEEEKTAEDISEIKEIELAYYNKNNRSHNGISLAYFKESPNTWVTCVLSNSDATLPHQKQTLTLYYSLPIQKHMENSLTQSTFIKDLMQSTDYAHQLTFIPYLFNKEGSVDERYAEAYLDFSKNRSSSQTNENTIPIIQKHAIINQMIQATGSFQSQVDFALRSFDFSNSTRPTSSNEISGLTLEDFPNKTDIVEANETFTYENFINDAQALIDILNTHINQPGHSAQTKACKTLITMLKKEIIEISIRTKTRTEAENEPNYLIIHKELKEAKNQWEKIQLRNNYQLVHDRYHKTMMNLIQKIARTDHLEIKVTTAALLQYINTHDTFKLNKILSANHKAENNMNGEKKESILEVDELENYLIKQINHLIKTVKEPGKSLIQEEIKTYQAARDRYLFEKRENPLYPEIHSQPIQNNHISNTISAKTAYQEAITNLVHQLPSIELEAHGPYDTMTIKIPKLLAEVYNQLKNTNQNKKEKLVITEENMERFCENIIDICLKKESTTRRGAFTKEITAYQEAKERADTLYLRLIQKINQEKKENYHADREYKSLYHTDSKSQLCNNSDIDSHRNIRKKQDSSIINCLNKIRELSLIERNKISQLKEQYSNTRERYEKLFILNNDKLGLQKAEQALISVKNKINLSIKTLDKRCQERIDYEKSEKEYSALYQELLKESYTKYQSALRDYKKSIKKYPTIKKECINIRDNYVPSSEFIQAYLKHSKKTESIDNLKKDTHLLRSLLKRIRQWIQKTIHKVTDNSSISFSLNTTLPFFGQRIKRTIHPEERHSSDDNFFSRLRKGV